MIRRSLAVVASAAALLVLIAGPAAAHPLGNATVSRATAVTISPDVIEVVAVVDMAEISAYAAILEIDTDGDEDLTATEMRAWAQSACADIHATLSVHVDVEAVHTAASAAPELTFPPGVGGLETLRLECAFAADAPEAFETGTHEVVVSDGVPDGQRGWREVTIEAEAGVTIINADVPAVSPSAFLTAYPEDLLQAPIVIGSGTASYRTAVSSAIAPPPATTGSGTPSGVFATGGTDALVDLLDGGAAPWSWLLAVAIAAGLGAAHAVSPGHGKALIAAYVIGSRGSMRRAAGLGLTVAGSHTIGVFVLGAILLSATELLVPDRVVAWLSVASGVLVVGLGASVARRAWRTRNHGARERDHGHEHPHPHSHPDSHPHGSGHGHAHPHPPHFDPGSPGVVPDARPPATREFLTLGLVGGMVPSTSALLVLLVAVATGRLVEGLLLIVAFGAGMAIVLGGLAAVTALARNGLADAATKPGASGIRRLVGAAPLASAVVIIVMGVATTVGALSSL